MAITCFVSLSDQVFFSIVAASLEAYKVNHSTNVAQQPVETYGNLWGYITEKNAVSTSIIKVVFADVDTSAERLNGSVLPNTDAFTLKSKFLDNFLPEFEYIGDFHSHPYSKVIDGVKTVSALETKKLYDFTKADVQSFKSLQTDRNFKLALAVTVLEMNPIVKRGRSYINDYSCIRFIYDNVAIWIKAHAYINKDGSRKADANVAILCPSIGFNYSDYFEALAKV